MKARWLILLFVVGCGVKGDPIPPGTPSEIGRGKPSYRRAVEELELPKSKRKYNRKQKKEDDDDDD